MGGAAAILGAITAPAQAGTEVISENVWYAAGFTSTPSPFTAGFAAGTSPPDGHPTTIATTGPSYSITLSAPGTFIITDVEASGDQFTLTFTGATTGAVTTSTPAFGQGVGECISCALSLGSFYSHGTYALNAGTTVITGEFIGSVGYGDVDFEATSVPELSTWAMMMLGFAGLGYAGYRKGKSSASVSIA